MLQIFRMTLIGLAGLVAEPSDPNRTSVASVNSLVTVVGCLEFAVHVRRRLSARIGLDPLG